LPTRDRSWIRKRYDGVWKQLTRLARITVADQLRYEDIAPKDTSDKVAKALGLWAKSALTAVEGWNQLHPCNRSHVAECTACAAVQVQSGTRERIVDATLIAKVLRDDTRAARRRLATLEKRFRTVFDNRRGLWQLLQELTSVSLFLPRPYNYSMRWDRHLNAYFPKAYIATRVIDQEASLIEGEAAFAAWASEIEQYRSGIAIGDTEANLRSAFSYDRALGIRTGIAIPIRTRRGALVALGYVHLPIPDVSAPRCQYVAATLVNACSAFSDVFEFIWHTESDADRAELANVWRKDSVGNTSRMARESMTTMLEVPYCAVLEVPRSSRGTERTLYPVSLDVSVSARHASLCRLVSREIASCSCSPPSDYGAIVAGKTRLVLLPTSSANLDDLRCATDRLDNLFEELEKQPLGLASMPLPARRHLVRNTLRSFAADLLQWLVAFKPPQLERVFERAQIPARLYKSLEPALASIRAKCERLKVRELAIERETEQLVFLADEFRRSFTVRKGAKTEPYAHDLLEALGDPRRFVSFQRALAVLVPDLVSGKRYYSDHFRLVFSQEERVFLEILPFEHDAYICIDKHNGDPWDIKFGTRNVAVGGKWKLDRRFVPLATATTRRGLELHIDSPELNPPLVSGSSDGKVVEAVLNAIKKRDRSFSALLEAQTVRWSVSANKEGKATSFQEMVKGLVPNQMPGFFLMMGLTTPFNPDSETGRLVRRRLEHLADSVCACVRDDDERSRKFYNLLRAHFEHDDPDQSDRAQVSEDLMGLLALSRDWSELQGDVSRQVLAVAWNRALRRAKEKLTEQEKRNGVAAAAPPTSLLTPSSNEDSEKRDRLALIVFDNLFRNAIVAAHRSDSPQLIEVDLQPQSNDVGRYNAITVTNPCRGEDWAEWVEQLNGDVHMNLSRGTQIIRIGLEMLGWQIEVARDAPGVNRLTRRQGALSDGSARLSP
jgi:hypothetical protein